MTNQQAILATLKYHSIFNYPLTENEIFDFLIGKKITKNKLAEELNSLKSKSKIEKINQYITLPRNKNFVTLRNKRTKISKIKKIKAKVYSNILATIPSVKLIATTGALAMENSDRDDDIDLLIVTSKNRLWLTRLLSNLALFPYKRSPKSKVQKDKACLNIFLDEADLKVKDKNVYTAHEITQMKVLYQSGDVYELFIKENSWIKKYLPNWKASYVKKPEKKPFLNISFFMLIPILDSLELKAKKYQLNYMKAKRTSEKISATQLFFHPSSTQKKVLAAYKK